MKLILIIGLPLLFLWGFFLWLKHQISYPYFIWPFEVADREAANIEDQLDRFLANGGFQQILAHKDWISEWRRITRKWIRNCPFKRQLRRHFRRVQDPAGAFLFYFVIDGRKQSGCFAYSFEDLSARYHQIISSEKHAV